jgi:hypothetical protein
MYAELLELFGFFFLYPLLPVCNVHLGFGEEDYRSCDYFERLIFILINNEPELFISSRVTNACAIL